MLLVRKVEICKEIEERYSAEHFDKLEKVADDITSVFKLFLKKFQEEYELTTNNSVYDEIRLYDVNSRVKNHRSLYEKLIRKNEIMYNKAPGSVDQIDDMISEMDDLIGVKIVTNLSEDCKKVHSLLVEKMSELSNITIYDIENSPDVMKNGRLIYKLKCDYKDDNEKVYNFELQIKSKIDSAWGDLEHNLYYKDYDYHSLKDDNKKIMVNIGTLLEEVEKMMLILRQSKSKYKMSKDKSSFIENTSDTFGKQIKEMFHIDLLLNEYYEFIYDVLHRDFEGDIQWKQPVECDDFFAFTYEMGSVLEKNFAYFKENSNHIQASVNVYLNLLKDDIEGNEVDFITRFANNLLLQSFKKSINKINRDEEVYHIDYFPLISDFLDKKAYECKEIESLFLGKGLYVEMVNCLSIVKEILDENGEDESFEFEDNVFDYNMKEGLMTDISYDIIQVLMRFPNEKRVGFDIIDEQSYKELLGKVITRIVKQDKELVYDIKDREEAVELLRNREGE